MMSAEKETRQRVFARLREVLGEEAATALMNDRSTLRLVRGGHEERSGDPAQRAPRRSELRGEMGQLRGEMGQIEARLYRAMASQTRSYMAATIGAILTTGGLAFAAAGVG